MWFIDLVKLVYEAITSGKTMTLLAVVLGLGSTYWM